MGSRIVTPQVTYQFVVSKTDQGRHCICRNCGASVWVKYVDEIVDWMNRHEDEGCDE